MGRVPGLGPFHGHNHILAQVPKEEWEGATLRNSQTKCNSLYPMEAPASSDEAYSQARGRARACAPAHLRLRGLAQSKARAAFRESKGLAPRGAALALETASAQAVEKWWAGLGSLARSEASRLVLHAHNLKFLLLRCGMRRATDPAACSATARRATHGHVGRMWQRGVGVASCDVRLLNFLLRRSPSPPARHRLTCLAKWMIERPWLTSARTRVVRHASFAWTIVREGSYTFACA